jgi:hypothetical protein
MGQRLVVSIEKNEKTIAGLYFHWSAYTGDALYVTRDIVNCIYNHKDETEKEMLLRLIRFCEDRGGGIDGSNKGTAWKYITELYPNETFKIEGINRSDGLIALDEENILGMKRMSEGDVFINLDTDEVDFCVYSGYESLDEYIEERESWDDEFERFTLDELDYIDYDLGIFDVSDIDGLIKAFEKAEDNQDVIRFRSEIVELI